MSFTSQLSLQDIPSSSLYIVGTPIGNIGDISYRAVHILNEVDGIACEDTRHTGSFLHTLGIQKPLISLHQHNENDAAMQIVDKLRSGQRWAYVSDAGTPGLSDPGALLIKHVVKHHLRVIPIPGPSALTTLLSIASDVLISSEGRFQFMGFLPTKGKQRQELINSISISPNCSFLYESPQRIASTLKDLSLQISNPERVIVVGRELTKMFESIYRLDCQSIGSWLDSGPELRGEFVLLIQGKPKEKIISDDGLLNLEPTLLIRVLSGYLGSKQIAEVFAKTQLMSKNEAYELALQIKNSAD